MFVLHGTYRRGRDDEYVATDLSMKNKEDQSYIVHDLNRADKFNTREDAEKYLDEYNLRNAFWEVLEL